MNPEHPHAVKQVTRRLALLTLATLPEALLLAGLACTRDLQSDSRDPQVHSGSAAGRQSDLELASGSCDERCARGALVQVFVGSHEAAARPVCSGAVIASGQGGALVLTAAHCLPQRSDEARSWVGRALGGERVVLHAVGTAHAHPNFQRHLVTAP